MLQDASELKRFALDQGFTTCGICSAAAPESLNHLDRWLAAQFSGDMGYMASPLRHDPSNLLPGVKSILAVSLNYFQEAPLEPGRPRIARYALGRDYHKVIRGKLKKIERWLRDRHPEGTFRACVDSAPILEREYAHRAGLGWFGKNTCLIDSRKGSWFFIGLLLSSVEFQPDEPAIGGCGTCRKCIDACPTGAIVQLDGVWSVDARRCISYLTIEKRGEFSPDQASAIGEWTFGCDVCQEVCPFNHPTPRSPDRAPVTTEVDFLQRRNWPSLVELATLNEQVFDEVTQGSATRRAGIDGLRRNAGENLRNGSQVKESSK